MSQISSQFPVYIEIGGRRCFAGAIDWPGWCRNGKDEQSALQTMFDYGSRYAQALRGSGLGFQAPMDASGLKVIERLKGNATTEFGAPDIPPSSDASEVDDGQLRRFETILRCCWRTFDAAVGTARGKTLRLGPRGGGRDLDGIVRHVLGGESAYLSRLARKIDGTEEGDLNRALERAREAVLSALQAAVRSGLPERGPRGGLYWKPRYFVRRVAWHVLDHAWEIEDRTT